MRSFTLAMIITGIMILCNILYTNRLDTISSVLYSKAEQLEQRVSDDDFTGADSLVREMMSFIEDERLLLAATFDHNGVDKIESTLVQLHSYTVSENKTDTAASAALLKHQIEYLPKNYKMKTENIL